MKLHANARTCLHGRRLIVERVCVQGWTLAAAAEAAGVSVRTVSKWLARFRIEGLTVCLIARRRRSGCRAGRPRSGSSSW